jgi:hypothetical protein
MWNHCRLGSAGWWNHLSRPPEIDCGGISIGRLGKIKTLFHETDKYRSSFLRLLFTLFIQITVRFHKNGFTGAGFQPTKLGTESG